MTRVRGREFTFSVFKAISEQELYPRGGWRSFPLPPIIPIALSQLCSTNPLSRVLMSAMQRNLKTDPLKAPKPST
jgi:hypothetical protein